MFEKILEEQNPHWRKKPYKKYVKRSCLNKLISFLKTQMIISIFGVRRSGKSSLMKILINYLISKKINPKNILFLNLEHPYFAKYANEIKYLQNIFEEYLKLMKPKGKIYIFLDEIQFFADWQIFVKALFEQKNVKFIISGSNSKLLSSDISTLLTGRTLILELMPFSFLEVIKLKKIPIKTELEIHKNKRKIKNFFDSYLKYGGFPEILLTKDTKIRFEMLASYVKTILYQDVIFKMQIKKAREVEKLFVYLISNNSNLFSYNNLSKFFDISDKAIKEYIKNFEESYLLFEIEKFSYSVKKQLFNPKKIFSIDTGIINATSFKFSENIGAFLENIIFLELKRLNLKIYYFKTKNNLEVDFLVQKAMIFSLIQVSFSLKDKKTKKREINSLIKAMEEMKLKEAVVITYDEEEDIFYENKKIKIIPIYKYLLLEENKKLKFLFK